MPQAHQSCSRAPRGLQNHQKSITPSMPFAKGTPKVYFGSKSAKRTNLSPKINFDTKVLLGVLGAQLARVSTVIPLHQVPILRSGAACTSCSNSFFCENFYRRNGNAQIGKSFTTASRRTSCFCPPLELLTGTTFLDGFWGPAGPVRTLRAI